MQWTQEYLVKEVTQSLDRRRNLVTKLQTLEDEVTDMCSPPKSEKLSPNKKSSPGTPGKGVVSDGAFPAGSSPVASGRGKGQSPRGQSRRGGGRGGRSRKDSGTQNPQSQEVNNQSLDARIKSIITNALMGDENNVGENAAPVIKKSRTSGKASAKGHGEKQEDKSSDNKTALGNSTMSIPVKISLEDVVPPASMPVSLPLPNKEGETSLRNLLIQSGNPTTAKVQKLQQQHKEVASSSTSSRKSKLDLGRSSSPSGRRESYSPISRPSSSSSTASAESVRHLEHGARVASVSPKGNAAPHQMINDRSANRPGSVPNSGHFSKGPLSVQTESKSGAAANPAAASALGNLYAGYPQFGAMLLGGYVYNPQIPASPTEKELYAKMLLSGSHPYLGTAGSSMVYQQLNQMNGISKLLPTSTNEDKGRGKPRRRRSNSKTVGGGCELKKSAQLSNHCSTLDLSTTSQRGSTRLPLSRATPEVVSMMSTASQPLAISAISDAESTKSSPLDKSPTKNLSQHHVREKHQGIHNIAIALFFYNLPSFVYITVVCLASTFYSS